MGKYIDWALVELERMGGNLPPDVLKGTLAEAESHLLASAERYEPTLSPDEAEKRAVTEFGNLKAMVASLQVVHGPSHSAKGDPVTILIALALGLWAIGVLLQAPFLHAIPFLIWPVPLVLATLFAVASFRAGRWQVLPLAKVAAVCTICLSLWVATFWAGVLPGSIASGPKWELTKASREAGDRANNDRYIVTQLEYAKGIFAPTTDLQTNYKRFAAWEQLMIRQGHTDTLALIKDVNGNFVLPSLSTPTATQPRTVTMIIRPFDTVMEWWLAQGSQAIQQLKVAASEERDLADNYQRSANSTWWASFCSWFSGSLGVGAAFAFALLLVNGFAAGAGLIIRRWISPRFSVG